MLYTTLPSLIKINNIVYHLYKENVNKDNDIIPNWWQYWYSETFTSLPPEVLYKNGDRVYYNFLFACEETEEATINDLLDRVNHMKIMTQKELIDSLQQEQPEPYFYCKYGGKMPLCSSCKRNHINSPFKTEEITTWYVPSNGTKHCIDYIQQELDLKKE